MAKLVEEEQVARLQLALVQHRPVLDDRPERELRGGEVRQRDAVLGPEPHRQSGAVEAPGRAGAAPHVGDADLLQALQRDLVADLLPGVVGVQLHVRQQHLTHLQRQLALVDGGRGEQELHLLAEVGDQRSAAPELAPDEHLLVGDLALAGAGAATLQRSSSRSWAIDWRAASIAETVFETAVSNRCWVSIAVVTWFSEDAPSTIEIICGLPPLYWETRRLPSTARSCASSMRAAIRRLRRGVDLVVELLQLPDRVVVALGQQLGSVVQPAHLPAGMVQLVLLVLKQRVGRRGRGGSKECCEQRERSPQRRKQPAKRGPAHQHKDRRGRTET